jgi:branched-chain amino acid transport system permease protein
VRDNETLARVIGVPVLKTKLVAFALSSAIIGIVGALWAFTCLRMVEPQGFNLHRSFDILFIIGGLATIRGAYLGAGRIVGFPLLLSRLGAIAFGGVIHSGVQEPIHRIIISTLILIFLIAGPNGLPAMLDRLTKQSRYHVFPETYRLGRVGLISAAQP